jgi:Tfp pilus assembly protein PilE
MKSSCRTNIPAFTLWELMIAMLITSLIVALSYRAYWRFTMILKQESIQTEQLHRLRLLERDLYKLTQECNTITREGDVLLFNFPDESCYLEFSDSTMTLVKEGINNEPEFNWDNQQTEDKGIPIEAWSSGYLNQHTDHIDRFQIRYRAGLQVYNLSFKKTYTNLFLYTMNKP